MSPAIPSYSFVSHRRHPSRLPSGALRAAWTGPGGDANFSFPPRGNGRLCSGTTASAGRVQCRVTGSGHTTRRILQRFVRYGPPTQFAFSVRGCSRRIMTMRSRPADIRVINRRFRLWPCRPALCLPRDRAAPDLLTRSPHIRTCTSAPAGSRADSRWWT